MIRCPSRRGIDRGYTPSDNHSNLERILLKLFTGERLNQLETRQFLRNINTFRLLHAKKFPHSAGEAFSVDEMLSDFERKSSKRKEEKLKFIFKRAYKRLIDSQLTDKDRLKGNITDAKKRIIESIKKEMILQDAVEANVPMDALLLPGTVRGKKKIPMKTFNKRYLKLLKRSVNFGGAFRRVLEELRGTLEEEVRKKSLKILERWNHFYLSKRALKNFKEFLGKDKCKLPWTLVEVRDAHEFTLSYLDEIGN